MKYTDAVEYLEALQGRGQAPDVRILKRMLELSECAYAQMNFVRIAGADGRNTVGAGEKGTAWVYTASVLKCAGYKAGVYLETPIWEYRERFQISGKWMTKKALCELTEQGKGLGEQVAAEGLGMPGAAELELWMALQYFGQQHCELVFLVQPSDVSQAMEELLVSEGVSRAADVLTTDERVSGQLWSLAPEAMQEGEAKKVRYGLDKQRFDYQEMKNLEISIPGTGQIRQALQAIRWLEHLAEQGVSVSQEALRKGLWEAACPGFFTRVGKKPCFVADRACGEQEIRELVDSLKTYFPGKRMIHIMGITAEAPCEKMIELTHSYAEFILTITIPGQEKAVPAYELASKIAAFHPNVTAVDSLEEAVEISYLLAGKEDVILAFGSPHFLGRLMMLVQEREQKREKKR